MTVALFRGRREQLCALTAAHNDEPYLSLWVARWLAVLPPSAIYILDTGSSGDDAAALSRYEAAGVQVVPCLQCVALSRCRAAQLLYTYRQQLLRTYRCVWAGPADQVVVPPENERIGSPPLYSMRPQCWELVQTPELPQFSFDAAKLLMQGRRIVASDEQTRRGGFWVDGATDAIVDPAWNSVHLHRVDVGAAILRHQVRSLRLWAGPRWGNDEAGHNLLVDHEQLFRWFSSDPKDPSKYAKLSKVPNEWLTTY